MTKELLVGQDAEPKESTQKPTLRHDDSPHHTQPASSHDVHAATDSVISERHEQRADDPAKQRPMPGAGADATSVHAPTKAPVGSYLG